MLSFFTDLWELMAERRKFWLAALILDSYLGPYVVCGEGHRSRNLRLVLLTLLGNYEENAYP